MKQWFPRLSWNSRGVDITGPEGPIYWLGPDLTLRDCTVVISATGRSLVPMSGQFIDCTLQAKGVSWAPMELKGCHFKGGFSGNDFGFRADLFDREKAGGVEDCDFSEAHLNGCRFFNCDLSTIRLPLWPCFTFLDARRHAAEMARRAWPGSFDSVIRTVSDPPEGTVASVWHAPTVARKSDTTVEALRAALAGAPGVVL
ncbi:hypothetical protein [Archangium primigenium]|uniref:hypothetical protein n=1 Tax=[Archangium] primigenium TaxID=2792470 RepID=UPI00195E6E27|nr:hypothetical protein [Archangium primigenium]MBM7116601.1 hypothetical protein [Archangium primigenium]